MIELSLSFIVPAYNAEKYLATCLNSLLSQNIPLEDYEIIIVNDGSLDNTLAIAQEFQRQYPLIKIVDQPNQGLSVARNNGFLKAKGNFIWFVDSDDWITLNCLKDLLTVCRSTGCDLLGVAPPISFVPVFPESFSPEDVSLQYSGKEWILSNKAFVGAWAYIVKRSFWIKNELSFYPGIYYEDTECMLKAFYYAKSIFFLNYFSVYCYVQHPESIMNSAFSNKKLFDRLVVATSLKKFSFSIPEKKMQFYYEAVCTNSYITGIREIVRNKLDMKTAREYIEKSKDCSPIRVCGRTFVQKCYQWVVIHCPFMYIQLRKLIS